MNFYFFPQTIGNHEFDDGPIELVQFLDRIKSPFVLANVDFTDEPQLHGKFLNSTILIRNGRKIGVIGVLANDTHVSPLISRISKSFDDINFN